MFVNLLKNSLESLFHIKQLKIGFLLMKTFLEFDLDRCSGYYVFDVE